MTGADLLARMKVLNNELRIAANGADEARALTALDMAQDQFQRLAAAMPIIGQTNDTVTTVANTESTAWPSGLLRIDRVWLLNSDGQQVREVEYTYDTGGHTPTSPWPLNFLASGVGAPMAYSASLDDALYWSPRPDAAYTLRIYGLYERTAITSRDTVFGWPKAVSIPLAATAVRILEMGIDDPSDELTALAEEAYQPIFRSMRKAIRSAPMPRHYTQVHYT